MTLLIHSENFSMHLGPISHFSDLFFFNGGRRSGKVILLLWYFFHLTITDLFILIVLATILFTSKNLPLAFF